MSINGGAAGRRYAVGKGIFWRGKRIELSGSADGRR